MNHIGNEELRHTNVGGVADLDTPERFRKVLEYDMLRLKLYDKVKQCIEDYRKTFGAEPMWVRISFDLLTRAGAPVFSDGANVCGLLFRTLMEENGSIEVGASCIERKVTL